MIRIELGKEVKPGIWAYAVPSLQIEGCSRQPLLDACRQIKSLYGLTPHQEIGLYREGRAVPDISCPVEVGAAYTVSEPAKGGSPKFVKYQTCDFSGLRSEGAAE